MSNSTSQNYPRQNKHRTGTEQEQNEQGTGIEQEYEQE
jgi:hypothetical protein